MDVSGRDILTDLLQIKAGEALGGTADKTDELTLDADIYLVTNLATGEYSQSMLYLPTINIVCI